MFNPLAPLSPELLDKFIGEDYRYFTRQTFLRAREPFNDAIKAYFLICHYDDEFRAREHFDTLKDDPNRFLYDWQNEEHQQKLRAAATQPAGYKIYANVFLPDWERHLTDRIVNQMKLFVRSLGWKPKREEGLHPVFYPHFGDVFVSIKFRGQEVKVNFEEIEKLR